MRENRIPPIRWSGSRSQEIITDYIVSEQPDPWKIPQRYYENQWLGRTATPRQVYQALWDYVKRRGVNVVLTMRGDDIYLESPTGKAQRRADERE